ncbi:MAG: hypothetical protein WCG42_04535 [Parachlamydiaceae bacterium]
MNFQKDFRISDISSKIDFTSINNSLADMREWVKKFPLIAKIKDVAHFTFKGLLNIALYWLNPSLYAIGFLGGVVFEKQANHAIDKINSVWKKQHWQTCSLLTLGCIISKPIVLAAGSILCGAQLGAHLQNSVATAEDGTPGKIPAVEIC